MQARNRRDRAGDRGEVGPVALTQPLSTCGYLSTVWLLGRGGIVMNAGDYTYLGSHEAVALAVARNEASVGGMKGAIAERYHGLGVRIIDRTEPLPGFTMVANAATVSPHQITAIRAVFPCRPKGWRDERLGPAGSARDRHHHRGRHHNSAEWCLPGSAAIAAFDNPRDRVMSMALVHDILHRSDDFSRLDAEEYVKQLVGHLQQVHADAADIEVSYSICSACLRPEIAVPCGLIITDQRLGMTLVNMLVEQIFGTCAIDTTQGTQVTIDFPA